MKTKICVAAFLGVVATTPALAQEADKQFDGPRVEGLFGLDSVDTGVNGTDEFDGNSEDIFYGGAIGYDYQGSLVAVGVEAEIAGSGQSIEDSATDVVIDGSTYSGTARVDSGTEYYIGGRVGFVAGRGLLYGKAGYAMSSIDIDLDGTVDGVPESFNADIDLDGLRLGVGYEYHFTDLVYVKGEYRYTDYSGATIEAGGQSVNVGDFFEEYNLERNQLVLGVGVRF